MRTVATLLCALLLVAAPARGQPAGDALAGLVELAPLRGPALARAAIAGRPVVVTFFASWCPPCHAEFRHLNAAAARHGAAVTIVAVNVFEDFGGLSSPQRLAAFLDRHAPRFHVLAGGPEVRAAFGGIDRIPTLLVFDGGGRLAFRFRHAPGAAKTHVTEAELETVLRRLLGDGARR